MGASSSGSDAGGLGGSLRGIGAWGLCNGGILGTMRDTIAGLIHSLLSEGNEATLAAGDNFALGVPRFGGGGAGICSALALLAEAGTERLPVELAACDCSLAIPFGWLEALAIPFGWLEPEEVPRADAPLGCHLGCISSPSSSSSGLSTMEAKPQSAPCCLF